MNVIKHFLKSLFILCVTQVSHAQSIERSFEGRNGLHVSKSNEGKPKYSLAPLYSVNLKKNNTVVDLFLLNESLEKMAYLIRENELVLFDPSSNTVYYKGDKEGYKTIYEFMSKPRSIVNIYKLDVKVRFNDNKDKLINLYEGNIDSMTTVKSQSLNINMVCNEGNCDLSLVGKVFLDSGEIKKIETSFLVKLNDYNIKIIEDKKLNCTFEAKVKLAGSLKDDNFSTEDPKEIFSKVVKQIKENGESK